MCTLKYWNISYYHHLLLPLLVISVSTIYSLFNDDSLPDTKSSYMMKIFLSSSVSTDTVTSVEPTSGTSSKYIVNKYINYFWQLATKQFVLIAVVVTMIIVLVIFISFTVLYLKKRRSHEDEGKKRLILNYLTSYILFVFCRW